ncbi:MULTISPECIES: hypothetical protein [unclassified Mycolicibacterium]|uniref:hypothetical protein n=1 Tax=unclassified Mycolicibacterium TaxID=2636767 RepID=UPI002ED7C131
MVRFTSRLPLLADLPNMASLTYRVPADSGLFNDDGRWSECGHYPEVGDLSADSLQAEYDSPPQETLPPYFARLRPAGGDVAGVFSGWIAKCGEQFSVGGQDYVAKLETGRPGLPAGTSLLTVTNTKHIGVTGDWYFGPPGVQIVATESGGIAFEAWAVAVPGDEQRQEEQLAAMVRSFQEQPVPYPGPPVARWTPAQLSRLFVKSGQTNGRIDIAAPNDEVDEPRTEPPAEWVCDDDPLRASEYAGVSGADQPTGVDALVKYSGSYPAEGRGTPVTVVYREDPGVDYLARVRDWTAHCATHPESVPPLCVSSGLQPDFTPATATIEGEPVFGFRRFDPDETPGGHGGHPSCIGTAQAALTVRVAGLLVQTEMDIDAPEGPPDWDTAVRPLEAQVAQVIRVIHGAS